MSFEEDFSQCLGNSGLPVNASSIPSPEDLTAGVDGIGSWLNSLDPEMQAAADDVTASFPTMAGLADAGIAPQLGPLLQAVDELQASVPISSLVAAIQSCLASVPPG